MAVVEGVGEVLAVGLVLLLEREAALPALPVPRVVEVEEGGKGANTPGGMGAPYITAAVLAAAKAAAAVAAAGGGGWDARSTSSDACERDAPEALRATSHTENMGCAVTV